MRLWFVFDHTFTDYMFSFQRRSPALRASFTFLSCKVHATLKQYWCFCSIILCGKQVIFSAHILQRWLSVLVYGHPTLAHFRCNAMKCIEISDRKWNVCRYHQAKYKGQTWREWAFAKHQSATLALFGNFGMYNGSNVTVSNDFEIYRYVWAHLSNRVCYSVIAMVRDSPTTLIKTFFLRINWTCCKSLASVW